MKEYQRRPIIQVTVTCTLFDPAVDPQTVADDLFDLLANADPDEGWPEGVSVDSTEVTHVRYP